MCVDSARALWASFCFRIVLFEVCFDIAGSTAGVRLRTAGVVQWDTVGWTAALTADVRGLGDSDQRCCKLIQWSVVARQGNTCLDLITCKRSFVATGFNESINDGVKMCFILCVCVRETNSNQMNEGCV